MQDEVIRKALEVAVEGYDTARVAAYGGTIERDAMSGRNRETITPMIAAAIAAFLRALPMPDNNSGGWSCHLVADAVERAAGGGA